jgi:hypothetical protein
MVVVGPERAWMVAQNGARQGAIGTTNLLLGVSFQKKEKSPCRIDSSPMVSTSHPHHRLRRMARGAEVDQDFSSNPWWIRWRSIRCDPGTPGLGNLILALFYYLHRKLRLLMVSKALTLTCSISSQMWYAGPEVQFLQVMNKELVCHREIFSRAGAQSAPFHFLICFFFISRKL